MSAFPPNFVHSLDATHMLLTALECKRDGIVFASVHDSYWTHAATMDDMNRLLRQKFIELYSLPLLETLHSSVATRFPQSVLDPIPEQGQLDLKKVAESPYFFS
jgi:DNA-directed RNA polymerase